MWIVFFLAYEITLKQFLACLGSFHQHKIHLLTPVGVSVGFGFWGVFLFAFFLWHGDLGNETRDHFCINSTLCCYISGCKSD